LKDLRQESEAFLLGELWDSNSGLSDRFTRLEGSQLSSRPSLCLFEEQLFRQEEEIVTLSSQLSQLKASFSEHSAPIRLGNRTLKSDARPRFAAPKVVTIDHFEIETAETNVHGFTQCLGYEKGTGYRVRITQYPQAGETWYGPRSIAVQSQLNLPGVARLMGIGRLGEQAALLQIEEFGALGDFETMICAGRARRLPGGVNGTTLSKVVFGVAATMSQLHGVSLIHRDLTPSNVFVSAQGEPILGGFCLSKFSRGEQSVVENIGTPVFIAPELLDGRESSAVDVYAYGILLYSIFTEPRMLTSGPVGNQQRLLVRVVMGDRFVKPDAIPGCFWTLITECWDRSPERRPSFADITRRMMNCDDFTFEGTDMADYHAYRDRIVQDSSTVPRIIPVPAVASLRTLGIGIDGVRGLIRPADDLDPGSSARLRVKYVVEAAGRETRHLLVMFGKRQRVSDFVVVCRQRTGYDDLVAVWLSGALIPLDDAFDDWYEPSEEFALTDDGADPPASS
jgi:hypothetical protein